MKIKILKMLCGYDQPLPTHSLVRLLFIACFFVFSSHVHASPLPVVTEGVAHNPNVGSMVLLGFGLCSLLVVRRRKPWLS